MISLPQENICITSLVEYLQYNMGPVEGGGGGGGGGGGYLKLI